MSREQTKKTQPKLCEKCEQVVAFVGLFIYLPLPGKHGHVFSGEAAEIYAQERLQHACPPQSHEQE